MNLTDVVYGYRLTPCRRLLRNGWRWELFRTIADETVLAKRGWCKYRDDGGEIVGASTRLRLAMHHDLASVLHPSGEEQGMMPAESRNMFGMSAAEWFEHLRVHDDLKPVDASV